MSSSDLQEIVSQVKLRQGDPRGYADTLDYNKYDDFKILEAAIACKEAGFEVGGLEVAENIFNHLIVKNPNYAPAFYELAVVHRYQRRLRDALSRATEAVRKAPQDTNYLLFQAHMFYANGCWDEGDAALGRISPANPDEHARIASLQAFGAYLKEFPRERARYITDEIRRRHYWMNAEEVADAIKAAIREKRGFALIRLGDGEGTFARVSTEDEHRFADLYSHCRSFWTKFLLGEDFDPGWTGYEALTANFMTFMEQADVLGIAYWEWLDYEYSIAAERTIPCLLNINRYILENVDNITLCNQDVHLHLHTRKLLPEILKETSSVSIISCLDGIDEKVREMFGIADVAHIKIPSESYAPHLAHISKDGRPHFPQVFWEITHNLSRAHDGRVFLIAAGTFGKYYARTIKLHGGIALDLGSMVDGWMKLASRPFYGALFEIDEEKRAVTDADTADQHSSDAES